jgi:hypothetical protein
VSDKYTIEYETAGLVFEFTPSAGSKGDLAATSGEQTVVGKVDLNSPKSRTTFVREATSYIRTTSPSPSWSFAAP